MEPIAGTLQICIQVDKGKGSCACLPISGDRHVKILVLNQRVQRGGIVMLHGRGESVDRGPIPKVPIIFRTCTRRRQLYLRQSVKGRATYSRDASMKFKLRHLSYPEANQILLLW